MIAKIEIEACPVLEENGVSFCLFAGNACEPVLDGEVTWEKLVSEYLNAKRVRLDDEVSPVHYGEILETANNLRKAAEALEKAIPT